jgi:hypothetical protein
MSVLLECVICAIRLLKFTSDGSDKKLINLLGRSIKRKAFIYDVKIPWQTKASDVKKNRKKNIEQKNADLDCPCEK